MKARLNACMCALLAVAALAACGGDDGGSSSPSGSTTLRVFAAASLTDPFQTLGKRYEQQHAGVKVTFNFAGSNTLVTQITQGAPADVFASADTQNMQTLQDAALVDTPKTFVKNRLTVIVPASNPAHITSLKDLANDGVSIAVGDSAVPIGSYTLEVLDKMAASDDYGREYADAVKANFASKETSVTAISQKVQLGEVDAGYVYVSDAQSAGDKVKAIEIPEAFNVLADYPIAVVKDSRSTEQANAFIDYVLSADGQKTLEQYGFVPVE